MVPGVRLMMLTASASTRSDLIAMWSRSTALSGGGPGLTASHANCTDDSTRYHATRPMSRISEIGCTLPSIGTKGIGSSNVMTSAMTKPEMMLAAETVPHNKIHTSISQSSTHARSATRLSCALLFARALIAAPTLH